MISAVAMETDTNTFNETNTINNIISNEEIVSFSYPHTHTLIPSIPFLVGIIVTCY